MRNKVERFLKERTMVIYHKMSAKGLHTGNHKPIHNILPNHKNSEVNENAYPDTFRRKRMTYISV